jgi:hypothetical protein
MSRAICCISATGLCMGVECGLHRRLRASCGSDPSRKLISNRLFRWSAVPLTKSRISMPPAFVRILYCYYRCLLLAGSAL